MLHIIGLGNPGKEYMNTRHNVAWMLFDTLASEADWKYEKYLPAYVVHMSRNSSDMMLIKPDTFMNNSGDVVPYLIKAHELTAESLLVVQDDIDLPLGTMRLSYDRGDGGHNGIKSIVNVLGSKQFLRLRIGVSLLDETGTLRKPNVLGRFNEEEMKTLEIVEKKFVQVLDILTKEGKESAMNICNTNE